MSEKYPSSPLVELLTDFDQTDEVCSGKKRKRASNKMTSRSSDITDLVMEGLMFTIRQGENTVAVIEQKTKLEVDEVLENSEKIETKKGEKCLRNSSLLGLENLITMIESSRNTNVEQKYQNTITQENHTSKGTHFPNASLNKDSNTANKNQYIQAYEKNVKFAEDEDSQYEEDEDEVEEEIEEEEEAEEEEDIIPEALQDQLFQPPVHSFEKVNKSEDAMINKDLLMDDTDTDVSIRFGVTTERNLVFNKTHESQYKSMPNNNTNKSKSNVPTIISNQIITTDQIPLQLQKILKNRLSTRYTLTNERERNENNMVDHKMQTSEQKDISFHVQLKNQRLNCNTLESTQSLENRQISLASNSETRESVSSVVSAVEQKDLNISENRLRENEEELQKQSVSTDRIEVLSSSIVQDVTQEFYQDLTYLQKKKDLTNQYLNLRSRSKLTNTLRDTHTSEARVEMIKFFHDITRGAKVVVKRMSTKSIHSIIKKSSSLATSMH
ncbi:hypothetical protein WN55_02379 [Dufourea novaeangliae]|uniref:Uncharacterized protein n=2 Tax=Dufourea novaeangliae TaxID=178035 RepID=A0A154PHK4_DUFNO|nr:hypothetical protein WN55_02379 [Dufourea novaeangliae]